MTTTTTMTTRVLMLLAMFVCVTLAQRSGSQRCLCHRTSSRLRTQPTEVEDIQIHPPGNSCDRIEFVVSLKNGLQYCLDPKMKLVQKILRSFTNKPLPTSPPQLPEQR
ncbi:growth-regulated alpha protein-like [Hypomesus transpacificus]|uniref:growth-regulated alpha protein-like n=1 Tax=Hypomesus transpacificus TaxID=137520 RepID=UPI001F081CFA|nr:growth-regulated alpha protein-like [Hypomesus transpacificus]